MQITPVVGSVALFRDARAAGRATFKGLQTAAAGGAERPGALLLVSKWENGPGVFLATSSSQRGPVGMDGRGRECEACLWMSFGLVVDLFSAELHG